MQCHQLLPPELKLSPCPLLPWQAVVTGKGRCWAQVITLGTAPDSTQLFSPGDGETHLCQAAVRCGQPGSALPGWSWISKACCKQHQRVHKQSQSRGHSGSTTRSHQRLTKDKSKPGAPSPQFLPSAPPKVSMAGDIKAFLPVVPSAARTARGPLPLQSWMKAGQCLCVSSAVPGITRLQKSPCVEKGAWTVAWDYHSSISVGSDVLTAQLMVPPKQMLMAAHGAATPKPTPLQSFVVCVPQPTLSDGWMRAEPCGGDALLPQHLPGSTTRSRPQLYVH